MRQERLKTSIAPDERALLEQELNWWAKYEDLTDEEFERRASEEEAANRKLAVVWQATNAIPSPVLIVARPARVSEDDSIVARFAAFDFGPKKQGRREAILQSGWFLSGYISRQRSGKFALRQLAIEPENPGQFGVTADVLRGLNPTMILAKVHAYLHDVAGASAERHLTKQERDQISAGVTLAVEMAEPGRGRRGRRQSDLERIARLCLDEYHLRGKGWLQRVVERENRPFGTIRDWVRAATKEGYLNGERGPGQTHLEPGPKLRGVWKPPGGRRGGEG